MNRFEAGGLALTIGVLAVMSQARGQTSAAAATPVAYSQAGAPLVAPPAGQEPPPAAPGPSLQASLDAAQLALKTCKGLQQNVAVTVVDSAGVPKIVLASDGAHSRGVQSSTNKALTALAFRSATSELGEKSKTDTQLAGKLAANPVYNSRAGGLVILQGTEVLGAIGVGGAKGSEKDEACAKAGLEKLAAAH
jgi:uncharacterized protein GlcG (DUF336 family)